MRIHCPFQPNTVFRCFRNSCLHLWIVWTFGLMLGAHFAPQSSDPFFSLMRPSSDTRVSIVWHLVTVCIPLVLAAFAVNIHKPRLLLLISLSKAFQISYCSCLIDCCYGSAGWLMRFLFQFADLLAVPVFCWYCIRHISGRGAQHKKDLVISIVSTILIAVVDALVIAPFLARLIVN